MTSTRTRLLLIVAAAGVAATGVEASVQPALDWPSKIGGVNVGGFDNFIAAFAIVVFAFTLSKRCRLVAISAFISTCVTETVASLVSNDVPWACRVGHIGNCVLLVALVLLLNTHLRKAFL